MIPPSPPGPSSQSPTPLAGGAPSAGLAPYAACDATTRGRRYPEPPPRYRSEYQRDRDRIVHSAAFRRLEYKTQVFVNHEGDMFRTRLTHSIEVAQIARSIALCLGANEALTEAIALAHDLGHTPFGHAGQDALNLCMARHGGFEHNLQSLRVVDWLEERYAAFPGLNLTFEAREGILKHCRREVAPALGELGERFLHGGQASLEAQITNLADEIAYNHHDLDDGLRSGLLTREELQEAEPFRRAHAEVAARWPTASAKVLRHECLRAMVNTVVVDVVETSRALLDAAHPGSVDEVRRHGRPLIVMSPGRWAEHRALKRFLLGRLYRHYRVHRMAAKAGRIVTALFEAFMEDPRLLPPAPPASALVAGPVGEAAADEAALARRVADYIAGMTDRFAILEHERVFRPGALT
jgi:dGTPase